MIATLLMAAGILCAVLLAYDLGYNKAVEDDVWEHVMPFADKIMGAKFYLHTDQELGDAPVPLVVGMYIETESCGLEIYMHRSEDL